MVARYSAIGTIGSDWLNGRDQILCSLGGLVSTYSNEYILLTDMIFDIEIYNALLIG